MIKYKKKLIALKQGALSYKPKNHRMNKSRRVQLIAVILYPLYLVLLDDILVIQGARYEQAFLLAAANFLMQVFIMTVLSMAIGALTAKKPPKSRFVAPAGIEQFSVPTAEEGRAIQVLFGKRYIAGPNVVWYGDLSSTPYRVRSG